MLKIFSFLKKKKEEEVRKHEPIDFNSMTSKQWWARLRMLEFLNNYIEGELPGKNISIVALNDNGSTVSIKFEELNGSRAEDKIVSMFVSSMEYDYINPVMVILPKEVNPENKHQFRAALRKQPPIFMNSGYWDDFKEQAVSELAKENC